MCLPRLSCQRVFLATIIPAYVCSDYHSNVCLQLLLYWRVFTATAIETKALNHSELVLILIYGQPLLQTLGPHEYVYSANYPSIGLQSMDQWQSYFGSPKGTRLGSLANGTIFGQILAFPVVPWLCDHTGRRFPIFLGSALLVLGAILQAAAQNYGMFLASRMIIGFGGLIAVEPSPLLISELAYPTHRAVITAYYNNLWYLGAIFAAWITYGTQALLFLLLLHYLLIFYSYWMGSNNSWAWRIPSLLQGFMPLIQVLFVYLLPESPRYLILKGKHDEARRVLVKYHANGDEASPLVDFEMKEITLQIDESRKISGTGYLEFWRTKGNRHRLFLIIVS